MSSTSQPKSFSIGWDVGAWNYDKNSKSRDAIVILDETLAIVLPAPARSISSPSARTRSGFWWSS
jgi:hypothetical protein